MTKRRRKKINKIMHESTYDYVRKGKFDYLLKQERLFRKHELYLYKMNLRSYKKLVKRLLEKYAESE